MDAQFVFLSLPGWGELQPNIADCPEESNTDNPLYRAIEKARDHFDNGVPILNTLLTSTTDAPIFRTKGMIVYGFEPYHLAGNDDHTHGTNEFISEKNLKSGREIFESIVKGTVSS